MTTGALVARLLRMAEVYRTAGLHPTRPAPTPPPRPARQAQRGQASTGAPPAGQAGQEQAAGQHPNPPGAGQGNGETREE